jgi:hypothetical protein
MRRALGLFLVIAALGLGLSGCGGKKALESGTPIQDLDAPTWVTKGSGAFDDEGGKVFFGVGSASGIRNTSLLRATADNRARNDLAKIFRVYSSSLMRDYMASTSAGDVDVTSEEQHVEQAIKTVNSVTLSGVQIVDHWQHPATGEYYSLARLDMEKFKNSLDEVGELDARTKEYIRANADRLHEELKQEEGR